MQNFPSLTNSTSEEVYSTSPILWFFVICICHTSHKDDTILCCTMHMYSDITFFVTLIEHK